MVQKSDKTQSIAGKIEYGAHPQRVPSCTQRHHSVDAFCSFTSKPRCNAYSILSSVG
jgi:hypothetical protein